jgi:hypothetical protein
LSNYIKIKNSKLSVQDKFDVLNEVLNAIESKGIRPFLCFGTLLGMIREQSFMLHDLDLDIGILTSEASLKKIKFLLKEAGFKIIFYEGNDWPCRLKVIKKCYSLIIDIIFFHKENNHLLTYVKYADNYIIRKRKYFDLIQDNFLGRKVWLPEKPEEHLTENYLVWKKKSDYSHFLLTSPFTDFSLPIIEYCLFEQFYFELTRNNFLKAKCIYNIAKKNNIIICKELKFDETF